MPKTNSRHKFLLFALVLSFVGWYLWKNIGELKAYDFQVNPFLLLGAFSSIGLSYVILFLIWLSITASLGLNAPLPKAAKAWFVSHLGKYVPGKIALFLVRLDCYQGYSRTK